MPPDGAIPRLQPQASGPSHLSLHHLSLSSSGSGCAVVSVGSGAGSPSSWAQHGEATSSRGRVHFEGRARFTGGSREVGGDLTDTGAGRERHPSASPPPITASVGSQATTLRSFPFYGIYADAPIPRGGLSVRSRLAGG